MWVTKLKIWHEGCILRPKCIEFQVTDMVYLINAWKEKNNFYYTELHMLEGKENNIKEFIKALKKEKKIIKLEQRGNHIFTLNKEPISKQFYASAFNPKLIYIKPVIQQKDGYEIWEVASWDKETLLALKEIKTFKTELKYLKQTKLENIYLPKLEPKLSTKQKEAIKLAIKKGYYNYPKDIDLEALAKLSKVKRATFQEHLRKAEKKIIPFLTENL